MERKRTQVKIEYIVRDTQSGEPLDTFQTLWEAEAAIEDYNVEAENNGYYENNLYEIEIKKNCSNEQSNDI